MTQLETIRNHKKPIAIIYILSLTIVFGCNLLCDLDVISFSFTQHAEQSDHGDHHATGQHHDQPMVEHESTVHQHDESSEENCCDDLTKRFYSSLTNQTANTLVVVPVQMFKIILTLSKTGRINNFNHENLIVSKFYHLPHGPPDLKGRFVRVLINSFLI